MDRLGRRRARQPRRRRRACRRGRRAVHPDRGPIALREQAQPAIAVRGWRRRRIRGHPARAGTQIPLAPPSFADAETAVLGMEPRPAIDQVDPAARKRSRAALAASLRKIRKLEASAQAATARLATSKQALGVLQGNTAVFQITRRETVVGRSTDDQKVDVDLTEEGNASKVSRQQAFIKLRWNGEFVLRNVGKRNIMINNVAVESGRRAALAPHSLIEVGGLRLMFLPNPTLVRASEPEPF